MDALLGLDKLPLGCGSCPEPVAQTAALTDAPAKRCLAWDHAVTCQRHVGFGGPVGSGDEVIDQTGLQACRA